MEDNTTKRTLTTIVMILLVLLSGFLFISRTSNHKKLKNELVRSEALAADKAALESSMEKLKNELSATNALLNETIAEKDKRIEEITAELNRLRSQARSISNLKKQVAELESQNNVLSQELDALKKLTDKLSSENKTLGEKVTNLESENSSLKDQIAILNALIADNLKISAYRGKKDKLTLKASRTDKLMANFEIPADVANNLSFTVETPEGQTISSRNESSATVKVNNMVQTDLSGLSAFTEGFKSVEISYVPATRLSKGNYKVNLLSDNQHVCGVIIQLK